MWLFYMSSGRTAAVISECLVVEFRVTDDDCPLAEASRATETAIEAAPPLRRGDGYALLRFSAPVAVGETLDADDRVRYLHRAETDDTHTYRCLSKARCVVHRLIDEGFLVESVGYRDGVERHVGAVVGQEVLNGVLEAAGEAVGVRLERISPLRAEGEGSVDSRWDLTPAQAEAMKTAYEMGYFETPNSAATASELAPRGTSKYSISCAAFIASACAGVRSQRASTLPSPSARSGEMRSRRTPTASPAASRTPFSTSWPTTAPTWRSTPSR